MTKTWTNSQLITTLTLTLISSPLIPSVCTPPDVENGWTDFEMIMIPAGATVNVYCYEGFKNMGSAQLTCNSYGEIDGSARCEEIGEL